MSWFGRKESGVPTTPVDHGNLVKAEIDGNAVDGYMVFFMAERTYGWVVVRMWPQDGPHPSLPKCQKKAANILPKEQAKEAMRRRTAVGNG